MNSIEAPAYMPSMSMSMRASITRAQVRKVAEEDVLAMATQLKQWGAKLDELAAKVVAAGANARIGYREGIDELKAKYEVARARFGELKSAGKKEDIQARVKQIRAQVEDTTSDYDCEKLQERLAKIVGGVAVIKVGAATETEMKEKKARVEDALHATRAAVEEGIVPGGGVALLRTLPALAKLKLDGDQEYGVNIIRRAIEEPLRQIAQNGGDEGAVVVNKVREGKGAFGYNVATNKYEDLVLAGVIDPTKVVRVALQNAASVAALMLTTEALIAERPKGDKETSGAGGHDDMGGMGM